jgi:uncharacterized protein (TIGR00730 family)
MIGFLKSCWAQIYLVGHLFSSYVRLIRGVWKISKLKPPIVTVFGGSKLAQDHSYAQKAHELGQLLVEHNISVITGGGPGIMEAANCGASQPSDKGTRSVGITVRGLASEEVNSCADEVLILKHFFTRKWLLTRYATAFAVFPGGFGTLDELFEIATLMQVNRLSHIPIVLVGKDYWKPLLQWIELSVKEGLVLQQDADLLFVTDDVQEAFEHLQEQVKE